MILENLNFTVIVSGVLYIYTRDIVVFKHTVELHYLEFRQIISFDTMNINILSVCDRV